MAIEKRYSCNLCNGGLPAAQLIGLYFVTGGIEERDPRDCNHHICPQCLKSLAEIAANKRLKADG